MKRVNKLLIALSKTNKFNRNKDYCRRFCR